MSEAAPTGLEEEIAEARRDISSDSYFMSIGELTNLYRDGELIIRPEFQRFFRWDAEQKSRLVESVLLGIPLPSIFVAQREDGKWEIVDGLQRVATLLELQGELVDEGGLPVEPLRLIGTKYLSTLEGKVWESDNEAESLTLAQRLDVKRSKLDMKIIKRESSEAARYDLFQRLNSYGSPLTPQEMRSALLVSVNSSFYDWLEGLGGNEAFIECTALSDRLISEKYDVELILRFLILHAREDISTRTLRSFAQLLDDEAVNLAETYPAGADDRERVFLTTFEILMASGGPNVFRKWDSRRGFVGGFLNMAFEVIAMGLAFHVANGTPFRTDADAAARELWQRKDMTTRFATGLSTESRLARMLPLGRQLMAADQRRYEGRAEQLPEPSG